MKRPIMFRRALTGAGVAALALGVSAALAGSGVGDVFNLGVANTVNAESSLSGNVGGGPQLRVENAATTQNAFGVLGRITAGAPGTQSAGLRGINSATNGNGFGVWGFHQSGGVGVFGETGTGTGVLGRHTGASGTTAGVRGQTASGSADAVGVLGELTAATPGTDSAGVRGTNTATSGYGVFGENTGSGAKAVGVFGKSASGPGILGQGAHTGASLFSADVGVYACGAPAGGTQCPFGPSFTGVGIGGFFNGKGGSGIGAYGCGGDSCSITLGVPFGAEFSASGEGAVGVHANALGAGAIGGDFLGEGVGVFAASPSGLAGKFQGDVHVTGKLTRAYTSGTANQATPIAYATINGGGSTITGASTPNVTSTFDSVNKRYVITISGEAYDINHYTTVATPVNTVPRFIATQSAGSKLIVRIFDLTGALVQSPFMFTTFKP
jgi:hypothetical protein